MKQFSVAFVGCGGIAPMHLLGYRAHPDRVRMVAGCDVIPERAEKIKDEYKLDAAFSSVEAMLDGCDFEVAVVCTPTPVREEVVRPLVEAGKHIFIEKPFADNLPDAQRMADLCDEAGVKIAVDQNFRWHYPFHIARQAIQDGKLGNVLSMVHQSMFVRQDVGWRPECERHALAIMGIHWFDGFRWMLGSEAKSLYCTMSSTPIITCKGETEAFVNITFQNGTDVSFAQSFSSPLIKGESAIIGEKALLKLDGNTAALFDKGSFPEPIETWPNPFSGMAKVESAYLALEELLLSIENDTEAPNSGRDNLRSVALLEAAYRSAASGTIIEFTEDGLL